MGCATCAWGVGRRECAATSRCGRASKRRGWRVSDEEIGPVEQADAEVAGVTELIRRLATPARTAVEEASFPLVLAGNCNSSLGTVAGLGTRGLESSRSPPMPISDLEPHQSRRLTEFDVLTVPGAVDAHAFAGALAALASRVPRIYLHVDLDSLDISEARANEHSAPGGPSLKRILQCVRLACDRFTVAAAAVTAYDPALETDGRALAGVSCARSLVAESLGGPLRRLPRVGQTSDSV